MNFFVLFLGIFRTKKTEEIVKIEESPCKSVRATDDLLKTSLEKEEIKTDEPTDVKDLCAQMEEKLEIGQPSDSNIEKEIREADIVCRNVNPEEDAIKIEKIKNIEESEFIVEEEISVNVSGERLSTDAAESELKKDEKHVPDTILINEDVIANSSGDGENLKEEYCSLKSSNDDLALNDETHTNKVIVSTENVEIKLLFLQKMLMKMKRQMK